MNRYDTAAVKVTPLAGVWIEIVIRYFRTLTPSSHPSRVCGLKSLDGRDEISDRPVTPLAGVWIEIYQTFTLLPWSVVTPLAGVWIEIYLQAL